MSKHTSPREWRNLLGTTFGGLWTFGGESVTRDGQHQRTENAYYSAPITAQAAELLAAKLAKFGISAVEADSDSGNKRRIIVMESELKTHGDAIKEASQNREVD